MILLKVETELPLLPGLTSNAKSSMIAQHGGILTTPNYHKSLEESCDRNAEKGAYVPDIT